MAESLEVTATWMGGYQSHVRARGHELTIDEPSATDQGMMPTEAFCAAIASCFCLALAHVAGKRGRTLPGLEVVVRATRAGRELRYERFEIDARAEVADDELAKLIEPARRVCWVSNTLVHGVELEYRYTSVDGRTRR
ncbi:MAG TPA: OsmC family protein [Solirubrobacteraceae bacterium]|nr:OsmC family protein [Solirubrobacteraceae bacterium]